ncbi:MAG TPA: pirin family protein, partial [Tahibacter sp.]|nr:pirin family protein [Tahibacter sp.]
DVRPHPHIGLATVSYLFDGEIMHRDSLGTAVAIRPGEVNWMTAGRGIVHSERTPGSHRVDHEPIHGLQMWVALPAAKEEMQAGFAHHATAEFPVVTENGTNVRVVVGSLYGAASPVPVVHETFFGDVHLTAGATLPFDADHEERALYVVDGSIEVDGETVTRNELAVLPPGAAHFRATADCRLALVGGEPLDGPRHLWWNFVATTRERIEAAKDAWREQRFAPVPDETEFIPLPEH